MQRLRHRHAAQRIRALKCGATQRLGQQVITQWRAEPAPGLAEEYRHVLIALGRQLQLTVGNEFADGEIRQPFVAHLTLECRPFGAGHPPSERVRLGSVKQRLGVTVEFLTGHRVGIGEEPAQAIEALHLVFEAFFDTAVTLAGQQLEALPQLLMKQIQRRPGQQSRENPADEQHQQRDQPGRDIFADKPQDLWAHGVQRHRRNSRRQVRKSPLATLSYSY
ncbi:hypothetical protein D3C86_1566740 [compost metagenome]